MQTNGNEVACIIWGVRNIFDDADAKIKINWSLQGAASYDQTQKQSLEKIKLSQAAQKVTKLEAINRWIVLRTQAHNVKKEMKRLQTILLYPYGQCVAPESKSGDIYWWNYSFMKWNYSLSLTASLMSPEPVKYGLILKYHSMQGNSALYSTIVP